MLPWSRAAALQFVRICAVLAVISTSVPAFSGGFEVGVNGARAMARGGAFVARADDGSALDLNPGGLIKLTGIDLYLTHNTINSDLTFTRGPSVIPGPVTYGGTSALDPVKNEEPIFALGAMFVATTDLGTENWRLAIGAYGPSAGGRQKWPVSGGQRYMLTELDVVLAYASVAIAYGKKDSWGAGLTLQYAYLERTNLTLVIDGTLAEDLSPYYGGNDVESTIKLSDPFAFSAIAGLWMRLSPNIELGVSGRILPVRMNATGDIELRNTPNGSQFTASQLAIEGSGAKMNLVVPPNAKLGLRYRGLAAGKEVWDIELNAVYEAWSMMKEYAVDLDGKIKLFSDHPAPDLTIGKRWRDTFAVKLGGTWDAGGGLSLSAGGYWESGAVPDQYSHIDFPSFMRYAGAVGVGYDVGKLRFAVAYSHVFQEDRTVDEATAKLFQVRPIAECPDGCGGWDGVPVNNGTFKSSFDQLSVSANVSF